MSPSDDAPAATPPFDAYAALGLDAAERASIDAARVKSAYRRMALATHPDKNDGVDTDGGADQNFHVGGADAVVATFKRYGVFDDKVVIAAGLFNETLPILPTEQIALLRMDCDMYRSTIDALSNLYDKVAVLWQCIKSNCRDASS